MISLAPMAGISDSTFRLISKEFGADFVTTEMISARGLVYENINTKSLLKFCDSERPIAIQIFGNEPYYMSKAAEKVLELKPDAIDINAGCPAHKIVKGGAGSALMRTPKLFGEIVREVKKVSDVPVTVKIRSGWDNKNINAVEIAKTAEQCGVSSLTVHGRTREQLYSGKADLNLIRDVKNAVKIPVIGNGDVTSVEEYVRMIDFTGVDGVCIGRGAYGAPHLFGQIKAFLNGKDFSLTFEDKINVAIKHMNMLVSEKGEKVAVKEMRKHFAGYLKGLRNSAKYRECLNRVSSVSEVTDFFDSMRIDNVGVV
jgi:tRNA-dihydrouridine synthase B